jgi:hypothetical protein
MKIFIDNNNNILDINTTQNINLTEVEVDRYIAFQDKTDEDILLYKYIKEENGYCIVPQDGYEQIRIGNKTKKLDERIAQLEEIIATLLLEGVDVNA